MPEGEPDTDNLAGEIAVKELAPHSLMSIRGIDILLTQQPKYYTLQITCLTSPGYDIHIKVCLNFSEVSSSNSFLPFLFSSPSTSSEQQ